MEEIKCSGKTIFTSQRAAGITMHSIRRTSKRAKVPQRSYYCTECRGWHLTSTKRKPYTSEDE